MLNVLEGDKLADATLEAVCVKNTVYLPTRYLSRVIKHYLNPQEVCTTIGAEIIVEGKVDECRPLLNWLKCAMT